MFLALYKYYGTHPFFTLSKEFTEWAVVTRTAMSGRASPAHPAAGNLVEELDTQCALDATKSAAPRQAEQPQEDVMEEDARAVTVLATAALRVPTGRATQSCAADPKNLWRRPLAVQGNRNRQQRRPTHCAAVRTISSQ